MTGVHNSYRVKRGGVEIGWQIAEFGYGFLHDDTVRLEDSSI